jgi:hypothetical protein
MNHGEKHVLSQACTLDISPVPLFFNDEIFITGILQNRIVKGKILSGNC